MTFLKTTFLFLLLTITGASAQTASTSEWKELATVNEVIERIHLSTTEGNIEPLRHFSGALQHATKTMVDSKIPPAYKNAKRQTAIRKLGLKVQQLSDLVAGNAGDEELLKNFNEARTLYQDIADLSK